VWHEKGNKHGQLQTNLLLLLPQLRDIAVEEKNDVAIAFVDIIHSVIHNNNSNTTIIPPGMSQNKNGTKIKIKPK